MKISHTTRRNTYGFVVLITLLLLAGQALLAPAPASASPGAPPGDVPTEVAVPEGYTLRFSSRANGVQIYECQSGQWAFRAPRAMLFDPEGRQAIAQHYGGIDRDLTPGPWWDALHDSSRIRGGNAKRAPSPHPNSIPLLRLDVLEREDSGVFDDIDYIQRLNTTGGVGLSGTCHGGERREVPYTADYYFYGN